MVNLIGRSQWRPNRLVHKLLQDPDKQIRLLKLLHGKAKSREDVVRCELVVRNVDSSATSSRWNALEYVAVSYTWGPRSPTRPIEINGRICQVRYNCWLALWQMRLHDVGKLYWIDAICIDQDNPSEKASQVRLMGQIYSRAKVVAASVGEAGSDLDWILGKVESVPLEIDLRPILQTFASRPYFHRLWTLQEFLLGKDLDVFGGECRAGFLPLYSLIFNIPRNELACEDLIKLFKDRVDLSTSCTPNAAAIELSELVIRYSKRQCSDPRDKVYGLLSSLPSVDNLQMLPVDYSCTLPELLLRYVSAEIKVRMKPSQKDRQRYAVDIARLHESCVSIRCLIEEFTKASDAFANALAVHVRKEIDEAARGYLESTVHNNQSTPIIHTHTANDLSKYATGETGEILSERSNVPFGINWIFKCFFYCRIPPSEQQCPGLSPQHREFVAGAKWHEPESTDFPEGNRGTFFHLLLQHARERYLKPRGGDVARARARKLLLTRDMYCDPDEPSDCKYLLVPLETAAGDYIVHVKGAAFSYKSKMLLVCRRRRSSSQSNPPPNDDCYDVIGEASHLNYVGHPPHNNLSANLQLGALPMDLLLASLPPPHPLARMIEEEAFKDSVSRPPLRVQLLDAQGTDDFEDSAMRNWYGKKTEVVHFCPSTNAAASCGCVFQGS